MEILITAPEITEPLAIKDSGNITRFNVAAERNLGDLRALSLYLNATLIPGINAAVALLNQQLPYINTVSAADAAIRTNANNVASLNANATHMDALLAVRLRLTEIQSVANNMTKVLAAQGYAEEAHKWALIAESVANIGIATAEKAGLVKPGITMMIQPDGTIDVRQLVFALGSPVVNLPPKIAVGRPATVSLSAPAVILPGATVTAFHVSVDGGAVQDVPAVNNSAVFTFTPAGAVGTTVTLKVTTTDSVGNRSLEAIKTAQITDKYILPPTMVLPVASSTILAIDVTMSTSAFQAFGVNDTQTAAQFLIKNASGTTVYDSGEVTNMTTHVVMAPPITRGQNCTVCARHKGAKLGWSEYSPDVAVTISTDRTGERIDNKGTIIGKLGSNWIVWLDAAYRGKDINWGKYGTDLPGITNISGSYTVAEGWTANQILAQSCKDTHTSKQNTDYLKTQNSGADIQSIVGVPAAAHCFDTSINGTTAQLPNVQTGAFGFANKSFIDRFDPTAAANPTKKMSQIGTYWFSSEYNSDHAYCVNSGGVVNANGKYIAWSVCPALEIAA